MWPGFKGRLRTLVPFVVRAGRRSTILSNLGLLQWTLGNENDNFGGPVLTDVLLD